MQIRTASKYFAYVAKNFPVMCASGAFPAFPPVTLAAKWLDRLDLLSARSLPGHVDKLTRFRMDFEKAEADAKTPQDAAEARALLLSVSCILAEFRHIRTWQKAPALYLMIAFTGLEQAVDMPCKNEREREKRFLKRLRAIPDFLRKAEDTLEAVDAPSRGIAQTMIRDCARYLSELGQSELAAHTKAQRFLADSLTALRDFDRFLGTRADVEESDGPEFSLMAKEVLGTSKTAAEIYVIAEEEFNHRLDSLKRLEPAVKGPWLETLARYVGPDDGGKEPLDAVIRDIHRLRTFVMESEIGATFTDSGLRIRPQPLHLASTLRPVHYDPALGAWPDEPSRCYISPQIFSGRGFRDDSARLARIRREYPLIAARQTYPGRHLMNTQRRALGDSPMAQITNPLFMDGWLAFSENILVELGFLQSPEEELVHHQRALARAGLAMIDAGLSEGLVDQEQCLTILTKAGYSKDEALNRVRSVRLAPGSRVMPVLGLHELSRMRRKSGLPLRDFCTKVFAFGQIPLDALADLIL